jgi:hypothetical protein
MTFGTSASSVKNRIAGVEHLQWGKEDIPIHIVLASPVFATRNNCVFQHNGTITYVAEELHHCYTVGRKLRCLARLPDPFVKLSVKPTDLSSSARQWACQLPMQRTDMEVAICSICLDRSGKGTIPRHKFVLIS